MSHNEAIEILIEKQHEIEEYGATDLAIEALEKQIAKKPKETHGVNGVPCISCPICGEPLWYDKLDKKRNHCHECGQAIKWEDK